MKQLSKAFLVLAVAITLRANASQSDLSFAEGTWVLDTAHTEFGAGPFRSKSETLQIERSSSAELALRIDGKDWSGARYHQDWSGAPDGALEDGGGDTPLRAGFEWHGRDLLIIQKFPDVVTRIRVHFSDDGRTMTAAYLNRNGDAVATWVYERH